MGSHTHYRKVAANAISRLACMRTRYDRRAGHSPTNYGHFTTGGIDDKIDSTLPPVFSPNTVPRS
jgi:hypothetical protein